MNIHFFGTQNNYSALDDVSLLHAAPSIFTSGHSFKRDEHHYNVFKTIDVIDSLRKEGYYPVYARSNGKRSDELIDTRKHMLRFFHFNLLRAGSLVHVVDVETNLDAHGSFVGQTLGDTLGLIVLRLADFVAQIFQAGGAVEIFDGEDGTENAFETGVGIAFRILATFLKEGVVRVHLKIQKVRNGNGYFDFAELLRKLTHYFTSEWHLSGPLPEY